ncbi:MAG: hypothetical protein JWN04_6925, partial [Myxococcaceae bacterium]|nr:hypothetical protein [Myxococcaceae bacterium]
VQPRGRPDPHRAPTGHSMNQEHVYIGIRRDGLWHVYPAEKVTDQELEGVDVMRDLQSTMVVDHLGSTAKTKILWQATFGADPFAALHTPGHTCRGLELVRAYVERAQHAASKQ